VTTGMFERGGNTATIETGTNINVVPRNRRGPKRPWIVKKKGERIPKKKNMEAASITCLSSWG